MKATGRSSARQLFGALYAAEKARAAHSQHMRHAVQEPTVVMCGPCLALSLGGKQHADDRPLLVRHIAPTQFRLQKAALTQRSGGLGIHYVNTA